jgi:hypothetical protein
MHNKIKIPTKSKPKKSIIRIYCIFFLVYRFLKHLAAVSHTLWGNFEILRSYMDIFAKKKDTS